MSPMSEHITRDTRQFRMWWEMWPSPRPQRIAKEMEKNGRMKKPEGKRRWSHADAVTALAAYARKDTETFLQMHPVDFIIQYLDLMQVKRLLPREVMYGYRGPYRKTFPWIWENGLYA